MSTISWPPTTFLLSAAKLSQLPPDQGAEVAFVGRSNVGKSSALNAITGVKGLAKTSKTPGRTQLLNFFALDEQRRLVDLPGYGYAKVSEAVKARWQKTLADYLATRQSLRGLVLLIDSRHPLKAFDESMLTWADQQQLPVYILLTKADKLSRSAATQALKTLQNTLRNYTTSIHTQLFSAHNSIGVGEARKYLLDMLD